MFSLFRNEKPFYSGSLDPTELPGTKKKSFALPFNGGEIWFEHLDGMYQFSSLALDKLRADSPTFQQPSKPSAIGFVLNETWITEELAGEIVNTLCDTAKVFRRVCFIGADRETRKLISRGLRGKARFAYCFIYDFERAKEWLISEGE